MCRNRGDVQVSDPQPTASFPSSADFLSHNSRLSLRDNRLYHLFSFYEILSATDNFLSPSLSSSGSSASWRCCLRGSDANVLRRAFLGDAAALPARLAALCQSHHAGVVRLLGAALSGDHVYLVYDHVPGATLANCLRNPKNLAFTPLSSWLSRARVAADLAHGLEYIHHYCAAAAADGSISQATPGRRRGFVHNRIKSSGIIVTEPGLRAKICHFGAAELAGEVDGETCDSPLATRAAGRSDSRGRRIEGTMGYMAPEVVAGGRISKRSDVFAFGVVLLELISGREPLQYYPFDKEAGELKRVSLIQMAREAIGPDVEEKSAASAAVVEEEERRKGRVRRFVDGRLRDSYPVGTAEELVRVALQCVAEEEAARPEMVWVAARVSRVLMESEAWAARVKPPDDFSVSMSPR